MAAPLIVFDKVSHKYIGAGGQELDALSAVSLDIAAGEFVAVLGRNGSGKSTLAKHINALLLPSQGRVIVDGMDTAVEKNVWAIRQRIGMVFQNPDNQLVGTTVEEDVAFGPENLGIPSNAMHRRVEEALEAVRMTEYRLHPPHQLSGGQKQRVAIAGMIAMRPKCIVLDEPTAMLDPVGRTEVMETVRRLNVEEGITIIHITHSMDEAVAADRIVVMDEGRIALEGTPREVFSQVEVLYDLYLDVPQITALAHRLLKKGVAVSAGTLTVDELVNFLCQ